MVTTPALDAFASATAMLADNRLVVSHEIKIFVEVETVEVKEPVAAASA